MNIIVIFVACFIFIVQIKAGILIEVIVNQLIV